MTIKSSVKKNKIILLLCVTIVIITIAFIIVSMSLKKSLSDSKEFNVEFTNYRLVTSTKGGFKDPVGKLDIVSHKKIVNMDFLLHTTHDELVYEIGIKNNGNISAEIIELMASYDSDISSPVIIDFTNVNGRILAPMEETTIKLNVSYNKEAIGEKNIKGQIGIIASGK